ncbi:hypothetical protein IW140_005355 [Coemansia sp. RSA 1813]|nr:hypothetical protein EV178_005150 [Coemansia sp. RSA 1646]KAJ1769056.1 hypothetical protein LPJ74_004352 [Coemansia sp. RSA 1843]KAJ2086879.1 hypothetical protein IW138_005353 [Coemansia sp. RSA 986]KAJ2211683.1 hypothetical protein EV179_005299 [Coemansia sp. RSA 487]KAJ2565363.1 hypothetical protein IW140_005355 [Coemansia sp. RSA 1813]
MGKRKSSRKIVKKERPKLETAFPCLFCNHEKTIQVTMDKEHKVGNLKCKICGATYQAAIHHLSEAVDVYGEWIDACEEAKQRELEGLHQDGSSDEREYRREESPGTQQAGGRAPRGDVDEYGVPSRLSDESDIDDF